MLSDKFLLKIEDDDDDDTLPLKKVVKGLSYSL